MASAVIVLVLATAAPVLARSFWFPEVDVDITLLPDGSLEVR